MEKNLNGLLMQKEIYQILDGDSVLEDTDGNEVKMPYLSGSDLVGMSSDYGIPTYYNSQSRWVYVEDMMSDAVKTDRVSELLDMFFSSPKFADELAGVSFDSYEAEHERIVGLAIEAINKRLYFGGNRLCRIGSDYVVIPRSSSASVETPKLNVINNEYVRGLTKRAIEDVEYGRLDSALTKSRTLLEETFCYVISLRGEQPRNKGDIHSLFSQVSDLYNMHADKETDVRIKKLISGLNKVISGIAELRNTNSDAHGVGEQRVRIWDYHALLAVNSALSLAEFLLSVAEHAEAKSGG